MVNKWIILIVTSLLTFFSVGAQELKLGKVDVDDFRLSEKNKDTTAPALILDRYRETHFEYSERKGWIIVSHIQERIFILKKEGLDYANKKVSAYKNEGNVEKVSQIEGYTHILNGNRINTEKLRKNAIFEQEKSEYWDEYSWTMSSAGLGAIVEWEYTITSPFWKIDDLEMQADIPTLHYGALIRFPTIFKFNRLKKGYFEVKPETVFKKASMGVSVAQNTGYGGSGINSRHGTLNYVEQRDTYSLDDIPPLKTESFVNNPENYRYTIVYELGSVTYGNGTEKKYATSWDEVAKSIFENKRFGKQLENARFLKTQADIIKKQGTGRELLIKNVFAFIQQNFTWNGKYGKYVIDDLGEVWKRRTGNVAEINLMLIALLRKCGVPANPILVSTKEHGIPMFPTLEGFNYVIAGIEKENGLILMDATEKLSAPNLLSPRVYNWEGRLVKKNGTSKSVDLYPKKLARTDQMLIYSLTEDGVVRGEVQRRYTGLEAMAYRKKNTNYSSDERLINLSQKLGVEDISSLAVKNFDDIDSPILESFTFEMENGYDQVGDKIFLSPLLFLRWTESPFKTEKREYPIDFSYPFGVAKMVTVQLPKGYHIAQLPEPLSIALPDDMGSFYYNIRDNGSSLSLNVKFYINQAVVPVVAYEGLKKLYDQRVAKENEKVVLIKTQP